MKLSIDVGDLVIKGVRIWRVVGVYVGPQDTEDIIGLRNVDLLPGSVGTSKVDELLVPAMLIEQSNVYRQVPSNSPPVKNFKPVQLEVKSA